MQVLEIDLATAKKLYPNADTSFKNMLEESFTKAALVPPVITNLVNGWDDILKISGKDAKEFELREGETDDELAYRQAKLIASVYNGDTVLDASDTDQYKYYPWHKIVRDSSKPSGFGLSYNVCVNWHSASNVGVRLCFANENHAIDAGKKFIEIYERLKIR
jgi:hypothetical protein